MSEATSQVGRQRIIVVGLGQVAQTHLAVLAAMPDLAVVGGVDIRVDEGVEFRGHALPVYASVSRAAEDLEPTMVVVATPTPTHAAVCAEVASAFPGAEILVEKPVADNLADTRRLLTDRQRFPHLRVAYHLQHSPEVGWGVKTVRDRETQLGRPVEARLVFTDPYESDFANAVSRFGSSWLDSGINALSVLRRFCGITERASLREIGQRKWSTWAARFACRSGDTDFETAVITSWHVTSAAKTTTIKYANGGTLVLDHTAVAGYLFENGDVTDFFGTDGRVDRRYSHYAALYRDYFAGDDQPPIGESDLRLHELLLPS